MKILIIGDCHFRYELSYASLFKDGRKGEWESIKQTIYDKAKTCDAIVFLGDQFNARHNHSSVIKEFIDFLNGFGDKEVHMLVGNHERYGTSTALDFLKELSHDKWFVYTEPTLTTVHGQPAMMVPFMTPALLGVETKEQGVKAFLNILPKEIIPLAFFHQGVSDSILYGFPINFFDEIVLPKKEISEHFTHIFAGHVHGKQFLPQNIWVTGNVFTNNVGEQEKSIWTYKSTKTNTIVGETKLPVRGIYGIDWNDDPEKIYGEIPVNSIVKCTVMKRGTDIDLVKKTLKRFDASVIVEKYPDERTKIHFEDGGLDLSIDSLLKLYSEAKKINYQDLKEGLDLIKS
jgi:DNA repair exonuclease SbcCD nuclease subunit